MRILYAAMKHEYGRPELGLSFEHQNFFDCLHRMGHDILYFDFMALERTLGRAAMNQRLIDLARAERPDLIFFFLYEEQITPATLRSLRRWGKAPTLNWFADDHWRFDAFTRRYAPLLDCPVTTAASMLNAYRRLGCSRVLLSQWAANPFRYRPCGEPVRHAVTFVGQPHGSRRLIVQAMQQLNIPVQAYGHGWPAGRVTHERMVELFATSRINLNLANPSRSPAGKLDRYRKRLAVALHAGPLGPLLRKRVRPAQALEAKKTMDTVEDPVAAARALPPTQADQIKGRVFEVPACGGFLLTGHTQDLDSFYQPGREVVTFRTFDELTQAVEHYLAHDDERARIARAGYERTLREHTYVHRFNAIFEHMGLPVLPADAPPGAVREVT